MKPVDVGLAMGLQNIIIAIIAMSLLIPTGVIAVMGLPIPEPLITLDAVIISFFFAHGSFMGQIVMNGQNQQMQERFNAQQQSNQTGNKPNPPSDGGVPT